jgi:hypothetical protein
MLIGEAAVSIRAPEEASMLKTEKFPLEMFVT